MSRTKTEIREHYELEKALANVLRHSTRKDRRRLYTVVYDELFRQIPHHPLLIRKHDPATTREAVTSQMRLLRRFLKPATVFLELGPGDCSLSFAVAQHVTHVHAVDVSAELMRSTNIPKNVTLTVSDGIAIPLPDNSVDVAYSNQLIEHLHPEDLHEQAHAIWRVLEPGGMYLCVTPNRLSGPHDISRGFDTVATGFHLKEYTNGELDRLFRQVGFAKTRICIGVKGHFAVTGVWLARCCERILETFPASLTRRLAGIIPFRSILGIWFLAIK